MACVQTWLWHERTGTLVEGILLMRQTVFFLHACDSRDDYCDSADKAKEESQHSRTRSGTQADYGWFLLSGLRHDTAQKGGKKRSTLR